MVTAKTQYSLRNAQSYFEDHLCIGDYYEEGQKVSGEWIGLGAQHLSLSGRVRADDFLPLCENRSPSTGRTLTQRLRTTRMEEGQSVANRRVFYDFTVSPPKSVSLVAYVGQDRRIIEAHERAIRTMMRELESFAATRVRSAGQDCDRLTGNIEAALFTHDTSRALDPHLHTHCIIFNATFDPVEKRWKALQNYELLRARKYAENVYYHELSRELRSFGYRIENRMRGDFEIEGVSDELCQRFSKRDAQVDAAVADLLAKRPDLAGGDIHEIRRRLATSQRPLKQKDISRAELGRLWNAQMTETERESLRNLAQRARESEQPRMTVKEAVHWAGEHYFDRNSVVLECQLWQEALSRARGENFSIGELKECTQGREYIRNEARPGEVSRRDVLQREWDIVRMTKEGVGKAPILVPQAGSINPKLDDEQRLALFELLGSKDRVAVFRGGAGTGKSYVLGELVAQIQQSGGEVIVLAPQRQQVVEMERSGFSKAETVTSFLQRRQVVEGAVVVVDEAGQSGGRQMLDLLQCVREQNGRLVLSGDTRQHGPVEASDALVAIERHSGVRPVELHKIRRQDPTLGKDDEEQRRIQAYRQAVEAAAKGMLADSFRQLDQMGAVVSCRLDEQGDKLAQEYVRMIEQNASAVVVSQTWAEVHRVNTQIRDALKSKGLVDPADTVVQALDRIDLTNAQKRDQRFYPPDAVIIFNQKVRHAEPGAKGKLTGIVKAGVLVEVNGVIVTVADRFLDRMSVSIPRDLALAKGDRLHLKANRKLVSGAKVTNGELVTVNSVRPDGGIELADGRVLDASYREFLPGYAVTSYGSQGKTVDFVLFSDSTIKAATNAQQWYVSISRGRRGIRIFTPDKEQLRENLARTGQRPLAMELAGTRHQRFAALREAYRPYFGRFGEQFLDWFLRVRARRQKRRRQSLKHTQKHEHQTP